MQGIFQKENTDKALKYGIYRHLPTYEKIIRNLVSFYVKNYKNVDKSFVVQKFALSGSVGFDTEHYETENIKINGIDAVYYRSNNNEKGIIFNDGNYIYIISGNIEKDELVKIAQNVE